MSETHFTIRIPRYDGCKTLAFNFGVFAFAVGNATYAALGYDALVSLSGAAVLAAVALANAILRLLTCVPVWRSEPSVQHDDGNPFLLDASQIVDTYAHVLPENAFQETAFQESAFQESAFPENVRSINDWLKANELPADEECVDTRHACR